MNNALSLLLTWVNGKGGIRVRNETRRLEIISVDDGAPRRSPPHRPVYALSSPGSQAATPSRTPRPTLEHPSGAAETPPLNSTTGAQADSVKAITTGLLAGRIGGRPVNFLLAPYSSGLSEVASKLANDGGALLVAAVSSRVRSF